MDASFHHSPPISPLPLWKSLLLFAVPSALAGVVVYGVMPILAARGLPIFFNYLITYATAPMLLLIAASLVAVRMEGRELSWAALTNRFRLNRMGGRDWLWAIGLTVFMFLTAGLLAFTARWIATTFPVPAYFPDELKPTAARAVGALPTTFMGLPLAGNWWIAAAMLASLVIATLGEELWWRGYILPRQELTHGRWTWVIHGFLWTLFHAFAPWNLIAILPGCLALSFVAQRRRNTWPGIVAHGLANGLLVMVIVVFGIAGGS
jgi:membrane protease YdiL (CAAX protease family)